MLNTIKGSAKPGDIRKKVSSGKLRFAIFGERREAEVAYAFLCYTLDLPLKTATITVHEISKSCPYLFSRFLIFYIYFTNPRYELVVEGSHINLEQKIMTSCAQMDKLSIFVAFPFLNVHS